jgi:small subunit ribosomal protein S27Ae
MAKKKKPKNKVPSARYKKYKISGNKIEKERFCTKCGEGIFLAKHKDRLYCGKCHYVEIIKHS